MYPKQFFERHGVVEKKGTAFVLIPFSQTFLPIFAALRETIEGEDLRMKCYRADDLYSTAPIMETILRGIASSEIVIADVTGRNANVFYELGIVHAVKDRCVILTQSLDDVPFDLRHLQCLQYENSISGATDLRNSLLKAIRDLLAASVSKSTELASVHESAKRTYFEQRLAANVEAKMVLARYVVRNLLSEGDSIVLDAGTTCYFVALELRDWVKQSSSSAGYAIMTHSYSAFSLLAELRGLNLFLAGGRYDRDYDALYGETTLDSYLAFNPRVAVLAAGGFTAEGGIFVHGNTEEVMVKRALYSRAVEKRIIILDHSKLCVPDTLAIVGLDDLGKNTGQCLLVTDIPPRGFEQKRGAQRDKLLETLQGKGGITVLEVGS